MDAATEQRRLTGRIVQVPPSLSLSLNISLSISLFLSLALFLPLSRSLSISLARSLSLSLPLALALALALAFSLALSLARQGGAYVGSIPTPEDQAGRVVVKKTLWKQVYGLSEEVMAPLRLKQVRSSPFSLPSRKVDIRLHGGSSNSHGARPVY